MIARMIFHRSIVMNSRIDEYYRDFIVSGMDLPAFHSIIGRIISDCASHIAMLGVTHYENEDIVWTVETAISGIQKLYSTDV